jgi:hypothetical protein
MKRKEFEKDLRHPYYFATLSAVVLVLDHSFKSGSDKKINFVFDWQPDQAPAITSSWDALLSDDDPRFGRHVGMLSFDHDENQAGLQAAHVLANHARRWVEDIWQKRPVQELPWPGQSPEIAGHFWTPEDIERLFVKLINVDDEGRTDDGG